VPKLPLGKLKFIISLKDIISEELLQLHSDGTGDPAIGSLLFKLLQDEDCVLSKLIPLQSTFLSQSVDSVLQLFITGSRISQ